MLPDPSTRATVMVDVPDPPWTVSYADGSGNRFRFAQSSADEDARYTYSPVTPERSSSGVYSGGAPAAGMLDRNQIIVLWRHVRRFEGETSLHAASRMMGTGSFVLVTAAGKRSFVIRRTDELTSFEDFLAPFRTAATGSRRAE